MFSKAFSFKVVRSWDCVIEGSEKNFTLNKDKISDDCTESMSRRQYNTTQSQLLTSLKRNALKNTVGKGKTAVTSIFSFSYSVFYSINEKNCHLSNL